MANGGGPDDRCAPVVPNEDDWSVVKRIGDGSHVAGQLTQRVPLDSCGTELPP